jgi:hypothetical protein
MYVVVVGEGVMGRVGSVEYREEVLVLRTCHTAQSQIEDGHTSDFVLTPERGKQCRFGILTRNVNLQPVPYDGASHIEPHNSAFMLIRLSDLVSMGLDPVSGKHRFIIRFSHYHHFVQPVPSVWPRQNRNPVAYFPMAEARVALGGLDFDTVDWKPVPEREPIAAAAQGPTVPLELATTIAEAARIGIGYDEMNTLLWGFIAGRRGG